MSRKKLRKESSVETMAACDKHVKDLNSTVKSLEEKEKQVHGDYGGLQGDYMGITGN